MKTKRYLDALLRFYPLDEELVRRCRKVTIKEKYVQLEQLCSSCGGRFICYTIRTTEKYLNNMDNNDAIYTIKVKELKEKPGKPIYLTFKGKDYQLLTDKRCLGCTDEDNICKTCKLKFRCFTSDALRVNVEDDLAHLPTGSQEPTIGEILDIFLASKGVDLTKIKARGKIIEDKRRKEELEEATHK